MPNYWIGDAAGRVLGPVSLQTIQDLMGKGRLRGVDRASTNGKEFRPLGEFPELVTVSAAASSPQRSKDEQKEADAMQAELAKLRGRPVHEIFGLQPDAGIEAYRAKFFLMV